MRTAGRILIGHRKTIADPHDNSIEAELYHLSEHGDCEEAPHFGLVPRPSLKANELISDDKQRAALQAAGDSCAD